jgi:hypothetical protein
MSGLSETAEEPVKPINEHWMNIEEMGNFLWTETTTLPPVTLACSTDYP